MPKVTKADLEKRVVELEGFNRGVQNESEQRMAHLRWSTAQNQTLEDELVRAEQERDERPEAQTVEDIEAWATFLSTILVSIAAYPGPDSETPALIAQNALKKIVKTGIDFPGVTDATK